MTQELTDSNDALTATDWLLIETLPGIRNHGKDKSKSGTKEKPN